MTLHNGSSLRSPLHNGIFSQLVKAPQIICAMWIIDPNGGTLHVDTVALIRRAICRLKSSRRY